MVSVGPWRISLEPVLGCAEAREKSIWSLERHVWESSMGVKGDKGKFFDFLIQDLLDVLKLSSSQVR